MIRIVSLKADIRPLITNLNQVVMKKLTYLFSFTFVLLFISLSFAQDALYKIEFISNWSSTTHPTAYPTGSDHWSPLIGTTHKDAATLLQLGMIASDGVEQVAETGGTSLITQEINVLIASGNAYEIINGSGLATGLGTITINDVNVDTDFPFISLITMIAPSPDWVAQINNLKLTDINDNWLSSLSMDVYATDAGTDSGTTYISANSNTNPRENISSLQNVSPFSNEKVGTFLLTLQQVLSVDENLLQNSISVYPNPSDGKVNINNSGNHILKSAEIYTIDGKKVKIFNQLDDQNRLEFESLTGGLYFLKLNSDKGSVVQKLLIK